MKELRKKLLDPNSTVVYYTLQVLDSVMKNCASNVHKEILSHEFMGIMKNVVTSSSVREVGERERERECFNQAPPTSCTCLTLHTPHLYQNIH